MLVAYPPPKPLAQQIADALGASVRARVRRTSRFHPCVRQLVATLEVLPDRNPAPDSAGARRDPLRRIRCAWRDVRREPAPQEGGRAVEKDETLIGLFPDADTEIVDRSGDRRTTVSRYRALGREGEATFHFTFGEDGDVSLREGVRRPRLAIAVRLRSASRSGARGLASRIELDGTTKTLVPEFAIKGPMQEQIDQMMAARARIQAGSKASASTEQRRASGSRAERRRQQAWRCPR